MSPPESKKPLPKCKALLLCDRCIIEERTHRISLINVFGTFRLASLPGRSPEFAVFVQLVDGIGRYQLEIQIVDLEHDRIIGRTNATVVEFPVRLMKRNIVIAVRSLTLPHPGKFDVIVLGDGDEIERQSFTVQLAGDQPYG